MRTMNMAGLENCAAACGKRVCVIGAGACGLAAAAVLKEYNHDVVVFEENEVSASYPHRKQTIKKLKKVADDSHAQFALLRVPAALCQQRSFRFD